LGRLAPKDGGAAKRCIPRCLMVFERTVGILAGCVARIPAGFQRWRCDTSAIGPAPGLLPLIADTANYPNLCASQVSYKKGRRVWEEQQKSKRVFQKAW